MDEDLVSRYGKQFSSVVAKALGDSSEFQDLRDTAFADGYYIEIQVVIQFKMLPQSQVGPDGPGKTFDARFLRNLRIEPT